MKKETHTEKKEKKTSINEEKTKASGKYFPQELSTIAYLLIAAFFLFVFIFTVISSSGKIQVWRSFAAATAAVAFTVTLIISIVAFSPKKNIYSIGFYILHAGILLLIIGMAHFSIFGESINVSVPNVNSISPLCEYKMSIDGIQENDIASLKGFYSQTKKADGSVVHFGFNFRISDFKTEYHDTEYYYVSDGESFFVDRSDLTSSYDELLYVDKEGVVHKIQELNNPKKYTATLEFLESDGRAEKLPLSVNHPVYRGLFKIYLMDVTVDEAYGYESIHLLIKRDDAEFISVSGIVLIILGSFLSSFLAHRAPNSKKQKSEVNDNE